MELTWAVSAGSPLEPHLVLLCLLLALRVPEQDILPYCPGLLPQTLKRLSANSLIVARSAELKERLLEPAGAAGDYDFRQFMPAALKAFSEFLNDPGIPLEKKMDHARWAFEKVTGKPTTVQENQDGFSLTDVHRILEEIRVERAEPLAAVAAVSAAKKEEKKSAARRWAETIPRETI